MNPQDPHKELGTIAHISNVGTGKWRQWLPGACWQHRQMSDLRFSEKSHLKINETKSDYCLTTTQPQAFSGSCALPHTYMHIWTYVHTSMYTHIHARKVTRTGLK